MYNVAEVKEVTAYMNTKNLDAALEKVELTYSSIVNIANDMMQSTFEGIRQLVNTIDSKVSTMTVDELREYMLRAQLRAYEISELKDKTAIKAACAEAVRKEKYAEALLEAEGTAGVKDNKAVLASSEEIVVELLYELISNLLKTKLDELHRLTDTLKSILMSRMQEAKFLNTSVADYIPPTTNGIKSLNNM